MFSLFSRLARSGVWPPPATAPAIRQLDTDRVINQAAVGMAYYLGLTDEEATLRAQAAHERRQRRCRGRPRADGPSVPPDQARKQLQSALRRNRSCLMALPFSGAALELLHELASDVSLPLILIDSPALAELSCELGTTLNELPRCPVEDAVTHVKIQIAQSQAVVYVSFPELNPLLAETSATTRFLGKACRFSMIEPLLCRQGLKALITIGYFPATEGVGPELISIDTPDTGLEEASEAIATLLRWLLGHLQVSASIAPDDTRSWYHLYRASLHCYQIERLSRIEQLDAYFNAWRSSPCGMRETMHRVVEARMAVLRSAAAPLKG